MDTEFYPRQNAIFDRIGSVQLTAQAVHSDVVLSEFGSLTSLHDLTIENTQFTDTGLEHLKGLTSLNILSLNLNDTQVTDTGLEHLKGLARLQRLYLDHTQVTDTGLEHLKGLTRLKELDLNHTQVTTDGRALLRKVLPNCRIFPEP